MIKYQEKELLNSTGVELYKKNKKLIPGGTQLLSKRPEMFAPDIWPSYYSKAKGTKIWDLDKRKFIDMSVMGIGAVILGYGNRHVDKAVIKSIKSAVQTTLNSPKEYALAEKLIELHPWFDMVRFSKSGGEAMAIAIRLARATTGRDKVLFNGYHGWLDWYLSANLKDPKSLNQHLMAGLDPNGVDTNLTGSSYSFINEEIAILEEKFQLNEFAAIVIEPARGQEVEESTLLKLKQLCNKYGIVFIYDEITSGFREEIGGIHRRMAVKPDIAVFAKSMGNGYPISAIIGTRAVMQSAESSFISSTNWTESIGFSASLKTIEILEKTNAHKIIDLNGQRMKSIWKKVFIDSFNLATSISGVNSLPVHNLQINQLNPLQVETFYTIELLKRGILGFKQFKPCVAHSERDFKYYEESLYEITNELVNNDFNINTTTPTRHSGFQRLTKE